MRLYLPILLLLSLALLAACKNDSKSNVSTAQVTTDVVDTLPAPTVELDTALGSRSSYALGPIQEACQLATDDWLRRNLPGFQTGVIKRDSRPSPDGHASSCVFRLEGQKKAFVIGYIIEAGNMMNLQGLIERGRLQDGRPAVPPYLEVRGLGQAAAFSKVNGELTWVTETGVKVYMYLFPADPATMKDNFNILYTLAPEINDKINRFKT